MSTQLDTREDVARELTLAPIESADSLTGLSAIEGIDLDLEVKCEHRQHAELHHPDEPAAYIVESSCRSCGKRHRYPLCATGWLLGSSAWWLRCSVCDVRRPSHEGYVIVEHLR